MKIRLKKLNESGFDHWVVLVGFAVLFAIIGTYLLIESHAATTTYVELHVAGDGGSCVDGTELGGCSSSNSQGIWATLSGSDFQIKDEAGQCLDDWNGAVGTNSKNRVYLRTNSCYAHDPNQEWNWVGPSISDNHWLQNAQSGGCINALGDDINPPTSLIVYGCYYPNNPQHQTYNNEEWFETSVSTNPGGGGGGSSSGEQETLCKDFSYGGPNGSLGQRECNNIGTALNFIASSGSGYSSWNNGPQLYCLGELWQRESGWNNLVINTASGAFGIAQALGHGNPNGSTTAYVAVEYIGGASAGYKYINEYPSYAANYGVALYQEIWGFQYISSTYGTPCGAWNHEVGVGWYVKIAGPDGQILHS